MKTRIILLTSLVLLLLTPASSFAQRLQLDSLIRLESLASEKVNIDIDPGMLKFASAFLKGPGDEAEMKKMLSELKGIYVRTFEFDREVDTSRDLEPIRKQLTTGSWVRLIGVDSKRDSESVEIYSWRQGNDSGGLAILVTGPNEVAVVNIVGPFDLARLAALRGLGVPDLSGNATGR
jgi:hypothetical protein